MVVYKITNIVNGKVYIGQTVKCPKKRFSDHKSTKVNRSAIHHAIKKYGPENFKLDVLDKAKSIEELNEKEVYWIKYYSAIKNGYNIKEGGRNGTHSEETKKKISQKNKGKNHPNWGKKLSKETREKISKAHKGRKVSPECRKRLLEMSKGKKHNIQTRKKMAASHIGLNTWSKGVKRKPESIAKSARSRWKKVRCVTTNTVYSSIKEASEKLNISNSLIAKAAKKHIKHTHKYVFEYVKEY